MPTLTLSHVIKRFGDHLALSDVSLEVGAGERVALLGHNGAGKSTLMKVVLGLMPADRGEVRIAGYPPGSSGARRIASYLPESVAFHHALTGHEQLRLFLRLRGEPVSAAVGLLERVGLEQAGHRRIGAYSKGMRQRLGLAQALIGRPQLLVLDEPTSGLDPVSRREFYTILDDLADAGVAILLSSHALTEVEARTDRIAILSQGHLVANDSLANLRSRAALPIHIQIATQPDSADEVARRVSGTRINGARVEFTCEYKDKLSRLADVTGLGALVDDVEIVPPSLEQLYHHFSKAGAEQ